jgi:hypothetical protein
VGNGTAKTINPAAKKVGSIWRRSELCVTKVARHISPIRIGTVRVGAVEGPDIEVVYPGLTIDEVAGGSLAERHAEDAIPIELA